MIKEKEKGGGVPNKNKRQTPQAVLPELKPSPGTKSRRTPATTGKPGRGKTRTDKRER